MFVFSPIVSSFSAGHILLLQELSPPVIILPPAGKAADPAAVENFAGSIAAIPADSIFPKRKGKKTTPPADSKDTPAADQT